MGSPVKVLWPPLDRSPPPAYRPRLIRPNRSKPLPEQRLALLKLQKRLLDADLVRRHVAVLTGLAAVSLYLPWPQVALSLAIYLPGDMLLTHALRRLIAQPRSQLWQGLMLGGAFTTMSGYLLAAVFFWQVPGELSKIVTLIYVFGGMLSVMLVRTVYMPLTVVNSLPLAFFAIYVGVIESQRLALQDMAFLGFAVLVLAGYFTLTLVTYLRIHRELAMARDGALARVETQRRFLATMSHELRTPLNGILGMSQALTRSHPGIGAEVIHDSARAMTNMVGDLLDNAAIDAGALRIELRPCALAEELQRVIAQWQGRFADRGLSLTLELHPGLPARVVTDPLRLSQCLSNLLSNALRHTAEGGVVVAACPHPTGLEISVTDSGEGLPPGTEARLFRPYEQIGTRQKSGQSGSGLGLSITRGLARAMGGNVTYERPETGGSRFRLTVAAPLPPVLSLTEGNAPDLGTTLRHALVLVVDDIATNRLVLRLLLSSRGVKVAEAASGQAALAYLQTARPDAVLMDLRMPGLSGSDTLALMRTAGFDGPVIAVSADVAPEGQRGALAAGFDGYLTKPVEDSALTAILIGALGSGAHL
jgi:signal transduction histidine kinase